MKITREQLLKIIKEELNNVTEQGEESVGTVGTKMREQWEIELDKIKTAVDRLYEKMPLEGKEALTAYYEKYAKHYAYKTREFSDDTPSWMRD
jgi:hypothetical protein